MALATEDADDALIQDCVLMGGVEPPPPSHTVWYTYTADAAQEIVVDTIVPSGPAFGLIAVATGTPGELTVQGCSFQAATIETVPGTTYTFLVSPDAEFSDNLQVRVYPRPPDPELHISVTSVTLDKGGVVHAVGTYRCTGAVLIFHSLDVAQSTGRKAALGNEAAYLPAECDGEPRTFERAITPALGRFRPGEVAVTSTVSFASELVITIDVVEQDLRLRRSH